MSAEARRRRKRRRKQHSKSPSQPPRSTPFLVADHTPERWGAHIQQAIATVVPLLPSWHPGLRYQREAVALCDGLSVSAGGIVVCEAPVTPVDGAWAVTEFSRRNPIPTAKMVLAAFAIPNPTLIIHELHHALTGEVEHTGWERMTPPFDPSKLKPP